MTMEARQQLADRVNPALTAACARLSERCQAQALPWSADTEANGRLLRTLRKEQGHLLDSLQAGHAAPDPDAISGRLDHLVAQAETAVHAYTRLPAGLMRSAHQACRQLEDYVARKGRFAGNEAAARHAAHQYRYLLLISLADLHSARITQLPAILAFLRDAAPRLHIRPMPTPAPLAATDFGLDLEQDAPPAHCARMLTEASSSVRLLDLHLLLNHVEQQLKRLDSQRLTTPGSENLLRTSLLRLKSAIFRDSARRVSRRMLYSPQTVQFGFRGLCLGLLSAANASPATATNPDVWVRINESELGCELMSTQCTPGRVQVGELVNLLDGDRPTTTSRTGWVRSCVGVIRWVRNNGRHGLHAGVEFLGHSLLPVSVYRPAAAGPAAVPGIRASASAGASVPAAAAERRSAQPTTPGSPAPAPAIKPGTGITARQVAQESFIMTCKLAGKTVQTLLLPVYHEFRDGEVLQVSIGNKSRAVRLQTCLQNNGLFSQFAIVDP